MKRMSGRTTIKIQNLQTKLCQHKSPDLQHALSKPLYITKSGKKRAWLARNIIFFQKIKKSSRTTDVMIQKKQKYHMASKYFP